MPTETEISPQEAMKSFQAGLGSLTSEAPSPSTTTATPVQQTPPPKSDAPPPEPKAAAQPPSRPEKEEMPRSSANWDKYRAKRDAESAELSKQIESERRRADELETKLKAGTTSPELDAIRADLEKAKKERDEFDGQLKVVAVTQHPTFKREFETRLNAQIELAKKIVPAEQQEAIERILSIPEGKFRDARIDELMETLSPVQTSRIGAILNAVSEINGQKQDIIKNAGEEHAKMTAAQAEQSKKRGEAMEAALKDSLAKASEHPLYKKSEDAAWNKDVDERLQQAEALARSSLSVSDSTNIVLNHLALPVVKKQLEASKVEIEKLKGQIADLTGANPGLKSRSTEPGLDDGGGTPVKIASGTSPMDAARSWVKSLPRLG